MPERQPQSNWKNPDQGTTGITPASLAIAEFLP
jgi:hypothetical protein